MPIGVGYSTASDLVMLPIGEHPCKLLPVELVDGENPRTKEPSEQIRFQWQGLRWKDPDSEKPGTISLWTGLKYGNNKAKLTALLDMIFGRALTQEEAERLDMEKLSGLKGYVTVEPYTKDDGSPGRRFGGFRHPENRPFPAPSQFYADVVSASGAPVSAVSGGVASVGASRPSRPASTNRLLGSTKQGEVDLPHPFGGEGGVG